MHARGGNLDFILCCFYRNWCWRSWLLSLLLLFVLSLFFSLSKYYINIIITIIIVLLLINTSTIATLYLKCKKLRVELVMQTNLHVVLFSLNDDSSRNHTCFIDLTMIHLWRNIHPYILSSRLLSSHPLLVFTYHVMIDNNCMIEDVYYCNLLLYNGWYNI